MSLFTQKQIFFPFYSPPTIQALRVKNICKIKDKIGFIVKHNEAKDRNTIGFCGANSAPTELSQAKLTKSSW